MQDKVICPPEKLPLKKKDWSSRLKSRDFTFSISDSSQFQRCIAASIQNFSGARYSYLYITHDKDKKEEGGKIINTPTHMHFLVSFPSPVWIDKVAQLFDIPVNLVQVVKKKASLVRYFIHLDNPEKAQYSWEEVVSNKKEYFEFNYIKNNSVSVKTEFDDFIMVQRGEMSPQEFLIKYRPFYASASFSQRINIYKTLFSYRRNP